MGVKNKLMQDSNCDGTTTMQSVTLGECVYHIVSRYLKTMTGHPPRHLYKRLLQQIERPIFEQVMLYTDNNQLRTAIILGLSRGTLRKKLRIYGLMPNASSTT